MTDRRRLALAMAATGVVVVVLAVVAPLRHVSGDTVPNRYGAALLRCGGGFDLRGVAWIDALDRAGKRPYWTVRARDGALVAGLGPAPTVIGSLALIDFGDGDTIDEVSLRRRARAIAALCVGLAAALLVLASAAKRSLRASVGIGLVAACSFAGAATLGQALWQQSVALPPLIAGLAALAWHERAPRLALSAPALFALAAFARPTFLPLAIGLGVAWCLERRDRRAWAIAAGLTALAIAPFVIWNVVMLGTPLPTGQLSVNARETDEVFAFTRAQIGYGVGGLLISPARGVLWFAPIAIVGVVRAIRQGDRTERGIAGAILFQVIVTAFFHKWWGGICFGPRMLAEAIWVAIWLTFAVPGGSRPLRAGAIAATLAVGLLGLFAWRAEQWETRRNPEIDLNAVWDFTDSPITSLFRSIDDQLLALDTVDAPPTITCDGGRLR